jgi:hypothetical protein
MLRAEVSDGFGSFTRLLLAGPGFAEGVVNFRNHGRHLRLRGLEAPYIGTIQIL